MKPIERALLVADKVHANKTYDIYPYMYHIMITMQIAISLGYDEAIVVACILHDCMEDGDLSYNDIKKAFGVEVAEIVFAVTDELGRNRKERKTKTYPKIRGNWKATVVKICDRIANMSHSEEFTPSSFVMYLKEHPDFVKNLQSADHPIDTQRAWDMLQKIVDRGNHNAAIPTQEAAEKQA